MVPVTVTGAGACRQEPDPDPDQQQDSGFSLSSVSGAEEPCPDLIHNNNNNNIKTPEFINISLLATPPGSPFPFSFSIGNSLNMDGEMDTRPPSSLCGDIILSSMSMTMSLNDSALSQKSEVSHGSVEFMRDGSLYSQSEPYSYLSKSQSRSLSSLLVRDERKPASQSHQPPSPIKMDVSKGPDPLEVDPDPPYVVQCPDCSYRFCSRCEFKEHPGKPCRLIGGTEELTAESEGLASFESKPTSNSNSNKSASFHVHVRPRKGKGSASAAGKQKKASLRRLANL
jgi:hypothetical protein